MYTPPSDKIRGHVPLCPLPYFCYPTLTLVYLQQILLFDLSTTVAMVYLQQILLFGLSATIFLSGCIPSGLPLVSSHRGSLTDKKFTDYSCMRNIRFRMEGLDSVFTEEIPAPSNQGSPSLNIHIRRKREKLVRRMRQFSSTHLLGGDSEVPKQSLKDSSTESTDSGCSSNYRRFLSSTSTDSNDSGLGRGEERDEGNDKSRKEGNKLEFRILVLGATGSGKTAIISQFLYDSFITEHIETVDEMYRGEFDLGSAQIALNVEDTGGNYIQEFRTMADISLKAADAFVLVYSAAEPETFEEIVDLRNRIVALRGDDIPVVVVGNKCDLGPQLYREELQATVLLDWNHGFVECSALSNTNVLHIFKELLHQADKLNKIPSFVKSSMADLKRRSSMPQVPVFGRKDSSDKLGTKAPRRKKQLSEDTRRKGSCLIS